MRHGRVSIVGDFECVDSLIISGTISNDEDRLIWDILRCYRWIVHVIYRLTPSNVIVIRLLDNARINRVRLASANARCCFRAGYAKANSIRSPSSDIRIISESLIIISSRNCCSWGVIRSKPELLV